MLSETGGTCVCVCVCVCVCERERERERERESAVKKLIFCYYSFESSTDQNIPSSIIIDGQIQII
jgi:hypothetical protein